MSSVQADREPDPSGQLQILSNEAPGVGRLPAPRTSFIGRETVVSGVRSLVLDDVTRLVTVVGTGGVGKTRIAIEAANGARTAFPVGAWFVSLAEIQHPQFVVEAIARELSVGPSADGDAFAALEAFLGSNRALLVLDNLEHLLDAAIDIDRLLATCPGLVILATSRTPLRLSGERVYRLDPMTLPLAEKTIARDTLLESEAGRLFIERAQSASSDSDFSDADARAIADICAKLDGLPLAIELAASQTRILTPASLLKQLDNRLRLLTAGPRDAPARQQTLLDTISWSYDLLPARQQALFRRLAICIGGFTFAAADALSGRAPGASPSPGEETFEDVCALVDSSLVIRTTGPGDEPRFSMLETIREFGLEQLGIHEEAGETSKQHAMCYQALAQHLRPRIEGKDGLLTLNTFEIEHANIRQALSWFLDRQDVAHAVRLTRDLWKFWTVRQHVSEARSWMAQTLALAGDDEPEGVVEILYSAGNSALSQGDVDGATRCVDRALAMAEAIGNREWIATHQFLLANIARHNGDVEGASEILQHGIALSRLNDPPGSFGEHRTAMLLEALAGTLHERGDIERALERAEEAHSIFERRGDLWGIARAMSTIAELAASVGEIMRAFADLQECLRLFHEIGDPRGCAVAISDLATLAVRTGQPSTAIRLFGAVESIREQIGAAAWYGRRPEHRPLEAVARSAAGDRFAELAWNEGKALSLEQAVQEALALAIPAPKRTSRAKGADIPHLTRRELEVLRLVVTGATDHQIADTLFIASRTVSTHMTSILNKLNVDNRTAAAALATRTGLV